MIDIIETVYRGASKGRGLVVSPKGRQGYLHRKPTLTFSKITQHDTDIKDNHRIFH